MADAEEATRPPRRPLDPLSRPVDLEFELDRDDPEAVNVDDLYESPDEEEEMLTIKEAVDLDDEYDLYVFYFFNTTLRSVLCYFLFCFVLICFSFNYYFICRIHDHAPGVVQPDVSEQEKHRGSSSGGTGVRHSNFEAVKEAGT